MAESRPFSEFIPEASWASNWEIVGWDPNEVTLAQSNKRVPFSYFTNSFAGLSNFNAHVSDNDIHVAANQAAGLDASNAISGANPAATIDDIPDSYTKAEQDVIDAAQDTQIQTHDHSGTGSVQIEHTALVGRYTADQHRIANITDLEDELAALQVGVDSKIGAVIEDTSPVLGGNLNVGSTNNYEITFTNTTDVVKGAAGYSASLDASYFVYVSDAGYQETDGGIAALSSRLELHGSSIQVPSLAHTEPAGYQEVRVSAEGILYAATPPAPGWLESATSAQVVPLDTLGVWEEISNLTITAPADVDAGDPITADTINLYIENGSGNRGGSVSIGLGIDGAQPTSSEIEKYIGPGYAAYVPLSFTSVDHGGLTTGQTLTIWAQRSAQDHSQFAPVADGSVNNHSFIVSVPSSSGGGTGGDPTNLGVTYSATTFTVTSSTGSNAAVAQAIASGNAGALSGADKQRLDDLGSAAFTDSAAYDAAGAAGTVQGNLDTHTSAASPHSGHLIAVQAGTNITVDNTDPQRPIVASTASGGWSDGTLVTYNSNATHEGDVGSISFTGGQSAYITATQSGPINVIMPVPPAGSSYTMDIVFAPGSFIVTFQANGGTFDYISALPTYVDGNLYRATVTRFSDGVMICAVGDEMAAP